MTTFDYFWRLGYKRLVPIIPPTAPISERSSLFKRIGTKQDGRGKTPGVKGGNGNWYGFDWVPHEASEADLERWQAMGAGLGIKTGDAGSGESLIAIDADTLSETHAKTILDIVTKHIGPMPARVGRYPKALYICRVSASIPYQRVEFGDERVELLSDGRQFVAAGVHPGTGQPYKWLRPPVALSDLPIVSPDTIANMMEDFRQALPEASKLIKEGSSSNVDQSTLRGRIDDVKRAVEATPNTSENFPSREAYRDYGYAIKAALPDEEDEALEIFKDWCFRWQDGVNELDIVEADWSRMKPPFRRGAPFIYELAAKHGNFNIAEVWFEDADEMDAKRAENPFAVIEDEKNTDTFDVLDIDDILNRPPQSWLVARHIPKVSMGFLYSEPGAGKTFITLDVALSIAAGDTEWNGDKIDADNRTVLYLAAEGSYGFRNRIKAWMQRKGKDKNFAKRFKMIERTINFMSTDDIQKLKRTVAKSLNEKPALIVVDTVSRSMPGADENLQKEMTLFVQACDALKDEYKCSVLGVHHAGKSGDLRGSTVLQGAGDFVFRLTRKKGASMGNLFCEKMKDAADGWEEPYRFDTVALDGNMLASVGDEESGGGGDGSGAGGFERTSLVVSRADMGFGPDATLTPGLTAQVMRVMAEAWEAGEPWAKAPQAKDRYAVRRLVNDFGFGSSQAEDTLSMWVASGLITYAQADSGSKRKGYKVVGNPVQSVQNEDIFS